MLLNFHTMAEVQVDPKFEEWLVAKLDSLEVDSETYGSYIIGILSDGEEEDCILKETLESIIEKDVDQVCEEILQQWKIINNKVEEIIELKDQTYEQDSAILSDLITSHLNLAKKQAVKKEETESTLSEERKSVKESVMALYGTMQSAETYGDEDEDDGKGNQEEVLFSNTNAQSVHNAEKQERNKRKEESMKKKEKDKMDLEMQKLKKIERKEKEKMRTQKRERGGK